MTKPEHLKCFCGFSFCSTAVVSMELSLLLCIFSLYGCQNMTSWVNMLMVLVGNNTIAAWLEEVF